MADDSRRQRILHGRKGDYLVGKIIGGGGNSTVCEVTVMHSNSVDLKENEKYAVKCFSYNRKKAEREKRKKRFEKEIRTVLALQSKIQGVLPIIDVPPEQQKQLWFLMPLADRFAYSSLDLLTKLDYALELGEILQQLHRLSKGFAHRDIKPDNILLLNNKVQLADFGLIWENNSTEYRITLLDDRLGAIDFRPPEMMHVTDMDMDYRPADVYMFAKTVWAVVNNSEYGFPGEYRRDTPEIYLDPGKNGIQTFEPLHRLLESATQFDRTKRISINDAVELLQEQRDIITHSCDKEMCLTYQTQERLTQAVGKCAPVRSVYSGAVNIMNILGAVFGNARLAVSEYGNKTNLGVLVYVSMLADNVFVFEFESDKRYGFCFDEISLNTDQSSITIQTRPIETEQFQPKYRRINEAWLEQDNVAFMDGSYDLIIELPITK